jgi:hypothetical protein
MSRRASWCRKSGTVVALAAVAASAAAQSTPAGGSARDGGSGTPPAPFVSRSLGLFAYPREGQDAAKQLLDEAECFAWARTQTGIDPLAPASPRTEPPASAGAQPGQAGEPPAKGALAGAAGGAVAGTAIGAIAGDAGKGAAIGATTGLVGRARMARKAAKEREGQAQAEARAQSAQAAQAKAAADEQRATFNRAFGACLEGRSYTVK